MAVGDAIYDILNGSTDITDAVGTKIYRFDIPQGTTNPCIKFVYDNKPTKTMDGTNDMDISIIDISVFIDQSDSLGGYSRCESLLTVIRGLFSSFRGTQDTTVFKNTVYEEHSIELMDEGLDGEKYVMGAIRFTAYTV